MALLKGLDESEGGAFGYERSQKGHGWSVRELAENLARNPVSYAVKVSPDNPTSSKLNTSKPLSTSCTGAGHAYRDRPLGARSGRYLQRARVVI